MQQQGSMDVLKRQAEAQMRRKAPVSTPLVVFKRQKLDNILADLLSAPASAVTIGMSSGGTADVQAYYGVLYLPVYRTSHSPQCRSVLMYQSLQICAAAVFRMRV